MSEISNFDFFSVERKRVTHADGSSHSYSVMRCPDWVNVIAFDVDGRLALVRQFRHGVGEYTVEFPGGIVDEGMGALETAKSELLEEVGLISAEWHHLGSFRPNAALQNNWCHSYICYQAKPSSTDLEKGCDATLVDAPTFIMSYGRQLRHQALMAAAILLAQKAELPADLRQLSDQFFR